MDSDPVESIDNTNYIEETKDSNFPYHVFSFEPIIVEDNLSGEVITVSEKELPPLKIIEYWNVILQKKINKNFKFC